MVAVSLKKKGIELREGSGSDKRTAIKFLKLGVDVNTVASGTGLSLDKVIEINRQLNK